MFDKIGWNGILKITMCRNGEGPLVTMVVEWIEFSDGVRIFHSNVFSHLGACVQQRWLEWNFEITMCRIGEGPLDTTVVEWIECSDECSDAFPNFNFNVPVAYYECVQ